MTEFSSHAALDASSRLGKARKIDRLLGSGTGLPIQGRMLEVGAGSGLISGYFGDRYKDALRVDAVDVADQRVIFQDFDFRTYSGRELPFDDGSFDWIVSNHVIEHVGSRQAQEAHLAELARVLSPEGWIYLAAPSKWQFVEPHFKLIGLSWIPRFMRDGYVRLFKKGDCYDCNPMGHRELERMALRCGLRTQNINARALHVMSEEGRGLIARWVRRIPVRWLQRAYRASPTMVYLLSREAGGA